MRREHPRLSMPHWWCIRSSEPHAGHITTGLEVMGAMARWQQEAERGFSGGRRRRCAAAGGPSGSCGEPGARRARGLRPDVSALGWGACRAAAVPGRRRRRAGARSACCSRLCRGAVWQHEPLLRARSCCLMQCVQEGVIGTGIQPCILRSLPSQLDRDFLGF